MKRIINPTIVHSATQPTEKVDLWIKALPNNQNTLMIFDNGYENVDSNLTERLNNEAQAREDADIAEANKRLEEDTKLNNRVDKEITDRTNADNALNTTLTNKINEEATARTNADNALSNRITTNLNSINTINSKIPSQASSTNQLADKEFVNSSIANDAATFQGTFETVNDLPTTNVKNNDYAFIVSVTSEGNPEYKRYKYNGTQWIEEFTLNNSSFTANQWAAINSGITDTWINDTNEKLENITSTTIIEITWSELKAKRDAGELTLGQLYRITDYQCTTTQSGTKSAGHQFDIIVLALSKNTLSEQAYAALHSGDTYFANNNLSAWKLWYCLDNDTTRFDWADSTNGKGVIYRMIDEFNNDVPYDFKNIQFYRQWDSNTSLWSTVPNDNTGVPCYTFSSEGNSSATEFTDMSLASSNLVESNVIKISVITDFIQTLNNICFFGTTCRLNTFENMCAGITLGSYCFSNTFRNSCVFISLGNSSDFNTIGGCMYITFGTYCLYNTLGYDCMYNSFGDYCKNNTLGDGCYHNSLGDSCRDNIFASNCKNNTLGDSCSSNSFGPGCTYNAFAADASGTTPASYFKNNKFESGVSYCILNNAEAASSSSHVQNYRVRSSATGTSSSKRVINTTRGLAYDITVALNSEGTIKTYCEADLVQ